MSCRLCGTDKSTAKHWLVWVLGPTAELLSLAIAKVRTRASVCEQYAGVVGYGIGKICTVDSWTANLIKSSKNLLQNEEAANDKNASEQEKIEGVYHPEANQI